MKNRPQENNAKGNMSFNEPFTLQSFFENEIIP